MANLVYPKFKEQLLQAGVNMSSVTIKAVLVDTASYTYNAADEFLTAIPAGMRVATSPALGTKTFTAGLFDAADTVFTAVTGAVSEALVLFVDTGTAGTSRLICLLDTGVTGLPVTPNGGDINVAFNASGIFQL
jgi:hypothetical protein